MVKQLKRSLNTLIEDYKNIPLTTHIIRALHEYQNIEFVENKVLEEALMTYIQQLDFYDNLPLNTEEYYTEEPLY